MISSTNSSNVFVTPWELVSMSVVGFVMYETTFPFFCCEPSVPVFVNDGTVYEIVLALAI